MARCVHRTNEVLCKSNRNFSYCAQFLPPVELFVRSCCFYRAMLSHVGYCQSMMSVRHVDVR